MVLRGKMAFGGATFGVQRHAGKGQAVAVGGHQLELIASAINSMPLR